MPVRFPRIWLQRVVCKDDKSRAAKLRLAAVSQVKASPKIRAVHFMQNQRFWMLDRPAVPRPIVAPHQAGVGSVALSFLVQQEA